MPSTYCIVLQPKGPTRNAQLNEALLAEGKPSAAMAGSILRRSTAPELIGTYKYGPHMIHLFGYKAGKAGTENKHELPPPHDKILLFGEAVLFMTAAGKFVSFNDADYKKWYNTALGGFEDLGDTDTEDDGEGSDLEELEEEEEEEEVAVEEEEEETEVPEVEEEEEEEEIRRPVPKISKAKRNLKKIPVWYSIPELTPEVYTLVK
jgi:hypothetical protein